MLRHFDSSQAPAAKRMWLLGLLLVLILFLLMGTSLLFGRTSAVRTSAANLVNLPLSFIPNEGQRPAAVLFEAPNGMGLLSFEEDRVQLALPNSIPTIELLDTQDNVYVVGSERQEGVANYYLGNEQREWQTAVPMYEAIIYQQLYEGIDLVYDGSDGLLKGTYIVAPHSDPSQISWRYSGVTAVTLDETSGNLQIHLVGEQTLTEQAPIAFQEINGQQRPVGVRYQLEGRTVRFVLEAYDTNQPLIIDPTLVYSSYLGGNSDDTITDVTTDSAGNVYVTGYTYSTTFPGGGSGNAGYNDLFVTKINAAGTAVLYTTFFGGSGTDEPAGMTVNGNGNQVWVTGSTTSNNLPTPNAFQPTYGGGVDAMILQLNGNGGLAFSSYYGGYLYDAGEDIALDSYGDVHLTGSLWGGFFAKIDAQTYEMIYSSMISGQEAIGYGIALDGQNNIYITGEIRSDSWPVVEAVQETCGVFDDYTCSTDAFVVKLSAAGDELLFSSYLGGSSANGGSGSDIGRAIAVDINGNIAITGETFANDFPIQNAAQAQKRGPNHMSDTFVTRLVKQGAGYQIGFSSYLGGDETDAGYAVTMNTAGQVFAAGLTNSTNLPTQNAWQPQLGAGVCFGSTSRNCNDAFITQFAANGSISFSTYWGGTDDDSAQGIAFDKNGNLYVVGQAESAGFPTAGGGFQPARDKLEEGFILKMNFGVTTPPTATPPPVESLPYHVSIPLVLR